jgi:hypothetical protein
VFKAVTLLGIKSERQLESRLGTQRVEEPLAGTEADVDGAVEGSGYSVVLVPPLDGVSSGALLLGLCYHEGLVAAALKPHTTVWPHTCDVTTLDPEKIREPV